LIDDVADVDAAFDVGLPIMQVPAGAPSQPGRPTAAGAHCSLDSLELAVGLARSGMVDAVVTGPVSKQQLYAIGFSHPGQTEFVAERCGVDGSNVAMMLAGPTLRVVPVTTHVSLAQAVTMLTPELIAARGRATLRGLQRNFGIAEPRLAVAGLNPHAGEGGSLGREEIDIIEPAIQKLREEGWQVSGPLPPDSMFHSSARSKFDAALCMYHDQALIPLKALHFEEGVNVTLGLPIVRTSPDHGTAFDIAGQDCADPRAMTAAIRLAATCAEQRRRMRPR
ncbi:MAG: 4-hydroxythreonine-4-phosphate dehydrogenase PdxA, partial [Sphingomicrobium sp.]